MKHAKISGLFSVNDELVGLPSINSFFKTRVSTMSAEYQNYFPPQLDSFQLLV